MPTAELTVEDQLASDLATYWNATRPADLANGVAIYDFRNQNRLLMPALIIGHEGSARESAKGMDGTGRVALRLVIRTDQDLTTTAAHRDMCAAVDIAIRALGANVLALTYVHAVLRQTPTYQIEDRIQLTVLNYTVIATRMENA